MENTSNHELGRNRYQLTITDDDYIINISYHYVSDDDTHPILDGASSETNTGTTETITFDREKYTYLLKKSAWENSLLLSGRLTRGKFKGDWFWVENANPKNSRKVGFSERSKYDELFFDFKENCFNMLDIGHVRFS